METSESITTLDLMQANESLSTLIPEISNDFKIGMLAFKKLNNKWKLVRIYADTKAGVVKDN